MCVCVCASCILHIIAHTYPGTLADMYIIQLLALVKLLITFSTSIFIMCVCSILLSRGAGALQMSIIIIIIKLVHSWTMCTCTHRMCAETATGQQSFVLHVLQSVMCHSQLALRHDHSQSRYDIPLQSRIHTYSHMRLECSELTDRRRNRALYI